VSVVVVIALRPAFVSIPLSGAGTEGVRWWQATRRGGL